MLNYIKVINSLILSGKNFLEISNYIVNLPLRPRKIQKLIDHLSFCFPRI
jgi:hypothetical protein